MGILRSEVHSLSILQMNGQVHNSWVALVNLELKGPPHSLIAGDVPPQLVAIHLVHLFVSLLDAEDHHIRSFVYVFRYVLDRLD